MALPELPDGVEERPFGYDGPLYTRRQMEAFGRDNRRYEADKQAQTIKRLRDRLEDATVAVEKLRDIARAFLANKNPAHRPGKISKTDGPMRPFVLSVMPCAMIGAGLLPLWRGTDRGGD